MVYRAICRECQGLGVEQVSDEKIIRINLSAALIGFYPCFNVRAANL